MGKKILIIDGHPDPDPTRLCHALAAAYARGATEAGHEVRTVDVATLDIPLLRSREEFYTDASIKDVVRVQENMTWADHVVIIYPLWLGTMPAMLKALIEQVFRPGYAMGMEGDGWPEKLLKGKSARVVVTMGMPATVYRWFYGQHSLRNLERNILKFCGFSPVRDTLFGMVEDASSEKRQSWLKQMETLGAQAG